MENKYNIVLETGEGTRTLSTPTEKAETAADFVKTAAHLCPTDAVGALDLLCTAKQIIDNMLCGLHGREELKNRTDFNKKVRIVEDESDLYPETEDPFTAMTENLPEEAKAREYKARNAFSEKLDSLISECGEDYGLNWIYEYEFVDQDRTKIQSIIIKFLGGTAEADTAEFSSEAISAKKRIVEAVEAAAADAANADNCIADYHFSMETAAENGKDITKFSIVFEN